MKFSSFLAAGSVILTTVCALPSLGVRGTCPTASSIATWLKKHTPIGDNTVFYTKPATNRDASHFAQSIQGHYYSSLIPQDQFLEWMDVCGFDSTQQDLLIPRICNAMAQCATGTAYVMLEPGTTPGPESVWMTAEYPALKARRIKVVAVDPRSHALKSYGGSRSPSPAPGPSQSSGHHKRESTPKLGTGNYH